MRDISNMATLRAKIELAHLKKIHNTLHMLVSTMNKYKIKLID